MTPLTSAHVHFLRQLRLPIFCSAVAADDWPECRLRLDLGHAPWLAACVAGRGWLVLSTEADLCCFTKALGWALVPEGLPSVLLGPAVQGCESCELWAAGITRGRDLDLAEGRRPAGADLVGGPAS